MLLMHIWKVKVKSLSRVWLFATRRTVAYQAPLPVRFSRQEYWSGCHFLLQEIFPTQGLNPSLPHCRQTLYRLSHQGSPVITGFAMNILACVLGARRCTVLRSTAEQLGSCGPKQSLGRILPGRWFTEAALPGAAYRVVRERGGGEGAKPAHGRLEPMEAWFHGSLGVNGAAESLPEDFSDFSSARHLLLAPTLRVSTPRWAFSDEAAPVSTIILWKRCDFSGASDHRS